MVIKILNYIDSTGGSDQNVNCEDSFFESGILASKNHSWKQAAFLFEKSLTHYGAHHATLYNCGFAYCQLAMYDKGLTYFDRATEMNPQKEKYRKKREELLKTLDYCKSQGLKVTCFHHDKQGNRSLAITILGNLFSRTLFALQQDDEIRRLTRLQPVLSLSETRQWIGEQQLKENKITWAVIHPENGMIGVVALEIYGAGALFYYWIGTKYQNRGYGTQALWLLLECAAEMGIAFLFSSAYVGNGRSIHVMKKAAFTAIPYTYGDDEGCLQYYCKAIACDDADCEYVAVFQELVNRAGLKLRKTMEVTALC